MKKFCQGSQKKTVKIKKKGTHFKMKCKTKGNMKDSVTERVDSKKNGRQKEEHEEINEN